MESQSNLTVQASWSQILLMLLGFLIVRVCWKYARLWLILQGFKKQGAEVCFKIPQGIYYQRKIDTKNGDGFKWFKEIIQKNPKVRFLATHIGTTPIIYLVDPSLVKAFLSDPSKYPKSAIYEPFMPLLRHGLLLSHNTQWKKHKKTLSQTFRHEFIISQLPLMIKTTQHIFSREIEARKGKHIDILELFQQITGELVFRIFFGGELENITIEGKPPSTYLSKLIEITAENTRAPENLLLGLKGIKLGLFKRNRDYLHQCKKFLSFCSEMIQLKKKKFEQGEGLSETPDLLTILLQSQKQSKGTDDEFSDEEILHEFITFFFGGMDSTSHMLTMATYFFTKQSEEVQRALMKEATELSQAGPNISNDLLSKAENIHAFLKETLRVATPTGILVARDVAESHYIEDVYVKKGMIVNMAMITNNYNPLIYRDPYRFNLNRWIKEHPDFEHEAHKNPFSFTPFSAGPRNCIGQHLAIIQGKIILSLFLSTYNYTLPPGYEMHYKVELLYEPREILYLDIEKK